MTPQALYLGISGVFGFPEDLVIAVFFEGYLFGVFGAGNAVRRVGFDAHTGAAAAAQFAGNRHHPGGKAGLIAGFFAADSAEMREERRDEDHFCSFSVKTPSVSVTET